MQSSRPSSAGSGRYPSNTQILQLSESFRPSHREPLGTTTVPHINTAVGYDNNIRKETSRTSQRPHSSGIEELDSSNSERCGKSLIPKFGGDVVQMILEVNRILIRVCVEYQNKGWLDEPELKIYQARLQKNLIYLSSVADYYLKSMNIPADMPVPDFSPLPPAKNMQIKKVTEILERANASYLKMKQATREAWKNKLDKGGFQNTMVLPSVDSIVGDLQVSGSQPDTSTQTPTALSGDVNLLTTSANVSAQQAQFSNQNITLPPLPPSLPPHLLHSQPESHHDPFTSDPYSYKPFPPFQPPPGVNIRDTSALGSSNAIEGSNSAIHFMTAGYDNLPHSQTHIPSAVSASNNLCDFNGHNRAFPVRR